MKPMLRRVIYKAHIIVLLIFVLGTAVFHTALLRAAEFTWDFDTASEYTYDTSKLEISDGSVEVKARDDWYSSSWSYRKSLAITGSSGQDLANYQVKVRVPYDPAMQPDFDDLSFTLDDGTTSLGYWLEEKSDYVSATVWILVPDIPASPSQTHIYMYYGNTGATSQSDLADIAIAGTDFSKDDGYSIIEYGVAEGFGNQIGTLRTGPQQVGIGNNWRLRASLSNSRFDAIEYLGEGILLTGSRTTNAGRVLRSTDYGTTWTDLGNITGGMNIANIKSAGEGKAYILTGNSNIYRTTDYGANWTNLGSVSNNTPFNALYQRSYGLEASGNTVLVSDTAGGGGHIFRSTDSGENWTDLGTHTTSALYNFERVSNGLLVMSWDGTIMKSTDDGATWISKGTYGSSPMYAHRYIGNDTVLTASGAGVIYRSTDNGDSWTQVGNFPTTEADNIMNLGDGKALYSTYTGTKTTYYTSDYGATWVSRGAFTGSPAMGDHIDGNVFVDDLPNRPLGFAVTNQGYVITTEPSQESNLQKVTLNRTSDSYVKKSIQNALDNNFAVRTKVRTISVSDNAAWYPIIAINTDGNRMCSTTETYGLALIQRGNLGIAVVEFTGPNNNPCYSGITEIPTLLRGEYTVEMRKTSTNTVSVAVYDALGSLVGGNSLAVSSQSYQHLFAHFNVPSGWANASTTQNIDYVFARQYVANEPTAGMFSVTQDKYVSGTHQITTNISQSYTSLSGFTEVADIDDGGSIAYQISPNGGSSWYWFSEGEWVSVGSEGVESSNSAATINSNIDSLPAGNGQLSIKAFLSSDGSQSVKLNAVNLAYENDTTPPSTLATPDLKTSSDTGLSSSDNITNDQTPSFVGDCVSNDIIKIRTDGNVVKQQTCQSGSYDITLTDPLPDGVYAITVTASDAYDNESLASPELSITIDTTAPPVPVISSPSNGSIIDNAVPDVSGTGVSGDTVTVWSESATLCSALVSSGAWSCVSANLNDGVYSITATASDVAGNVSDHSGVISFTIGGIPFEQSLDISEDEPTITVVITTVQASTAEMTLAAGNSYINSAVAESSTPSKSHSLTVNNLVECATYTYRITVTDTLTNAVTIGENHNFTMPCLGGVEIEGATATNVPIENGGNITLEVGGKNTLILEIPSLYTPGSGDINFQIKKLATEHTFKKTNMPQGYSYIGDGVYKLIALKDPFSSVTGFDKPLAITLNLTNQQNAEILSWHPHTQWRSLEGCDTKIEGNSVTCNTNNFSLFGAFSVNNTAIDKLALTGMDMVKFALTSLCITILAILSLTTLAQRVRNAKF